MNDERVQRCYFFMLRGVLVPWPDQKFGQIAYKFYYDQFGKNPPFKQTLKYMAAHRLFDQYMQEHSLADLIGAKNVASLKA